SLTAYREALTRQPYSWVLMAEASRLLTHGLQDAHGGAALARCALGHNPSCSADLWNCLGEALHALGRVEDAHHAFSRALAINPTDAHAAYNLSCAHAARGEHDAALRHAADGLAWDRGGALREALLHKQGEVLSSLYHEAQQRSFGLANRVISPDLRALWAKP